MTVLVPDLIDRADIGMVESRSSLSFSLETSQGLGVSGDLVRQELQGHKTMESGVLSLVDDTHATAAQLLDDAVMRDGLADQSVGSRACWERMLVGGRRQVNQKLALRSSRSCHAVVPSVAAQLTATSRTRM